MTPVPRTSFEKAKALKLFKSHQRTSSDHEPAVPVPDSPSPSRVDPNYQDLTRKSLSAQSDIAVQSPSMDTPVGTDVNYGDLDLDLIDF